MIQAVEDFAFSSERPQHIGLRLPILESQAVRLQNDIGDSYSIRALAPAFLRSVVARIDAISRNRVAPVTWSGKNST